MLMILATLFLIGATVMPVFRLPVLVLASAVLVIAAAAAGLAGFADAGRAFLAALLAPTALQIGFFCGAVAAGLGRQADAQAADLTAMVPRGSGMRR